VAPARTPLRVVCAVRGGDHLNTGVSQRCYAGHPQAITFKQPSSI